jgi:hypothetical protein
MRNMRNKLVSHPMCLNPRSFVNAFDRDSLQATIDFGEVLGDATLIGRMRDC